MNDPTHRRELDPPRDPGSRAQCRPSRGRQSDAPCPRCDPEEYAKVAKHRKPAPRHVNTGQSFDYATTLPQLVTR